MSEYRGLRAIAKRMGWKAPATLLRLQEKFGFLMYPRSTANGFLWVTNDDLIFSWEKTLSEEAIKWRKNRIKPPFRSKQGGRTMRKNGTTEKSAPHQ